MPFSRQWLANFSDSYDQAGNLLKFQGPDGDITTAAYDNLGRMTSVNRASQLSATVTYDDASRVTQVDYGNGTRTVYSYDDANRPTEIRHEGPAASVRFKLTYAWSLNNTVASRTEEDHTVFPAVTSVVSFTYDNRDRLIREVRTTGGVGVPAVYDIAYTYDQVGNRLTKTDSANVNAVKLTEYYYDTVAANRNPAWPTNNNRLMWYTEKVSDGAGGWSLQRTVYYTYTRNGDTTNITIKDESAPAERRDLALTYARNGQLWLAVWDQWTVNSSYTPTWPGDPCGDVANGAVQSGSYTQTAAREFRYDGGRARYMARDVDPNNGFAPLTNQSWTEYGGDSPYEDHNVTVDGGGGAVFAPQTAYLGLAATLDENSSAKAYMHEDLIGSNNFASDAGGNAGTATAYSAFGELVGGYSAIGGRYGYAGSYGYEAGLLSLAGANGSLAPVSLQHVGERWYQPGTGRFVQRDPIGIAGGINTYAYCMNEPVTAFDPTGRGPLKWLYTGDWNASDATYNDAVDAAATWLAGSSPVRGGYVGVGMKNNRGIVAGAGAQWTIDGGGGGYAGVGYQRSVRTRDPRTGRFSSGTGGMGVVVTSDESGTTVGAVGGLGQNQKAHGGHGMVGSDGTIYLGINAGFFNGGLIIDLSYLFCDK